jgi:hypothetical protein
MRAVFDALERLGVRYYVTGSVAASVHGVIRQSQDTDLVVDLEPADFDRLAQVVATEVATAAPIDYGDFAMASIIDTATAEKVDLILRRPGPFESSAMARRAHVDIPGLGGVWVATVEDLILAKLAWSEGTSELQLRDCAQLLEVNRETIDRRYLEEWARRLGLADVLRQVSDAT